MLAFLTPICLSHYVGVDVRSNDLIEFAVQCSLVWLVMHQVAVNAIKIPVMVKKNVHPLKIR